MADNTAINTGNGGDTIATDDLSTLNGATSSGVKVQRMKAGFGGDGDLTDVSDSKPLPVKDLSNNDILRLILAELRVQTLHLQQLAGGRDDLDRMRSQLAV